MSNGIEYCMGDQHTMKLYDSFAKSLDASEARTIILKISRALSQVVISQATAEAINMDFDINFYEGAERLQCEHASRILLTFIHDRCKIADKNRALQKASSDVIRCMAVATKPFLKQACAMLSHPINYRPTAQNELHNRQIPQLPLRIFIARLMTLILSIVSGEKNIKFQVNSSSLTPLKNYNEDECSKNLKQLLYVLGCLRPRKTWGQVLYDNKGTILLVVSASVAMGVAVVYNSIRGANSERTKQLNITNDGISVISSRWCGISYIQQYQPDKSPSTSDLDSFREHYCFLKLHRAKLIKISGGVQYSEDLFHSLILSGVGAGLPEFGWFVSTDQCIVMKTSVVDFLLQNLEKNSSRNFLHIIPNNSIFMRLLPPTISCGALSRLLHSPSQKRYLTIFKMNKMLRRDVAGDTFLLLKQINESQSDLAVLTIETIWQTPVFLLIKAIHMNRPNTMNKQDVEAETTFISNIEHAIAETTPSSFFGVIQGMKSYVEQNLLDVVSSDRFYYVWTCLTYFASKLHLEEIQKLWEMPVQSKPRNMLAFYSIDVNPWFAGLCVDYLVSQIDDHDKSCDIFNEFLKSDSGEHRKTIERLILVKEQVSVMLMPDDVSTTNILTKLSLSLPTNWDSFDFVVSIAQLRMATDNVETTANLCQKVRNECFKLSLKPLSHPSPFYEIIKHDRALIEGENTTIPRLVGLIFKLVTVIIAFAAGFVTNYVRGTQEIMEMIHLANLFNDCFYESSTGISETAHNLQTLKEQLSLQQQDIKIGFVKADNIMVTPILSYNVLNDYTLKSERALIRKAGSMSEVVKRPNIYFKALSRLLNERLKTDKKPVREFESEMGILQKMLGGSQLTGRDAWATLLIDTQKRVIDWFMKSSDTVFFAADNKTKNNVMSFAWNAINPINLYDRQEIAEHVEIQMSLLAGFISDEYNEEYQIPSSSTFEEGASKVGVAATVATAGGLILASGGTVLIAAATASAIGALHVSAESKSGIEYVDPIRNGTYTAMGKYGLQYTRVISDGEQRCTVKLQFLLNPTSNEAINIQAQYIENLEVLKTLYSGFDEAGKTSSALIVLMIDAVKKCHFVVCTMQSGQKTATTTIPFTGYMDYKVTSLIPTLQSLGQLTQFLKGTRFLPDSLDISSQLLRRTIINNTQSCYCEGKPVEGSSIKSVLCKDQTLVTENHTSVTKQNSHQWYTTCWTVPGCVNFSNSSVVVESASFPNVRGVGQNIGRTLLKATDLQKFEQTGPTTELNLKTMLENLNSQRSEELLTPGFNSTEQVYVFDHFPLPQRDFKNRIDPKLSQDMLRSFVQFCKKHHTQHPMILNETLFQIKVVLPYAFCVNQFWLDMTEPHYLNNIELSYVCMVFEAATAQRGMCLIEYIEPQQQTDFIVQPDQQTQQSVEVKKQDLLHLIPFSVAKSIIEMEKTPSAEKVKEFFSQPTINHQIAIYNGMHNRDLTNGQLQKMATYVVETIETAGKIELLAKIPVESANDFMIATTDVNMFSPNQSVEVNFVLLFEQSKIAQFEQQFLLNTITDRHNLRMTNSSKLPQVARVEYHEYYHARLSPFMFDERGSSTLITDNKFVVGQVEGGVCMIKQNNSNFWVFSQFLIYRGWDFLSDERNQDPVRELSVIKFLDSFYSTTKRNTATNAEVLNCLTSRLTSSVLDPCSLTIKSCVTCDVRSCTLKNSNSVDEVFEHSVVTTAQMQTCECGEKEDKKINIGDSAKPWRIMILLYQLADRNIFINNFGNKINDHRLLKRETLKEENSNLSINSKNDNAKFRFTLDPMDIASYNENKENPNIKFAQDIQTLGQQQLHPSKINRTNLNNLVEFVRQLSLIVWEQCSPQKNKKSKGFNYKLSSSTTINTLFVSPGLLRTMQMAFRYASMCVIVLQTNNDNDSNFHPIKYKNSELTLFGKLADLKKAIASFGVSGDMVSFIVVAQSLKGLNYACLKICESVLKLEDYKSYVEVISEFTFVQTYIRTKQIPEIEKVNRAYREVKKFVCLATCCVNYQCFINMFQYKNFYSTNCRLRQEEHVFVSSLPVYDAILSDIKSVNFKDGIELFRAQAIKMFIYGGDATEQDVTEQATVNELSIMLLITAYGDGAAAAQSLTDVWQSYLQRMNIGSMLCCALQNIKEDAEVLLAKLNLRLSSEYTNSGIKYGEILTLPSVDFFRNGLGMEPPVTNINFNKRLKPARPMGTDHEITAVFDHHGSNVNGQNIEFLLQKGIAALLRVFCNFDSRKQIDPATQITTQALAIETIDGIIQRNENPDVLVGQLLVQLVLSWFSVSYGYYGVDENLIGVVGMDLGNSFGKKIVEACSEWNVTTKQPNTLVQLLVNAWKSAHNERLRDITDQGLLLWRQDTEEKIQSYLYVGRTEVEKHGLTVHIQPFMLPQSVYTYKTIQNNATGRGSETKSDFSKEEKILWIARRTMTSTLIPTWTHCHAAKNHNHYTAQFFSRRTEQRMNEDFVSPSWSESGPNAFWRQPEEDPSWDVQTCPLVGVDFGINRELRKLCKYDYELKSGGLIHKYTFAGHILHRKVTWFCPSPFAHFEDGANGRLSHEYLRPSCQFIFRCLDLLRPGTIYETTNTDQSESKWYLCVWLQMYMTTHVQEDKPSPNSTTTRMYQRRVGRGADYERLLPYDLTIVEGFKQSVCGAVDYARINKWDGEHTNKNNFNQVGEFAEIEMLNNELLFSTEKLKTGIDGLETVPINGDIFYLANITGGPGIIEYIYVVRRSEVSDEEFRNATGPQYEVLFSHDPHGMSKEDVKQMFPKFASLAAPKSGIRAYRFTCANVVNTAIFRRGDSTTQDNVQISPSVEVTIGSNDYAQIKLLTANEYTLLHKQELNSNFLHAACILVSQMQAITDPFNSEPFFRTDRLQRPLNESELKLMAEKSLVRTTWKAMNNSDTEFSELQTKRPGPLTGPAMPNGIPLRLSDGEWPPAKTFDNTTN